MVNQDIHAITDQIVLIVKDRLVELDPSQEFTLKQMAGSVAWEMIEGREKSVGKIFKNAVKKGRINLVHVGDNSSNSNLYALI